MRFHTFAHYYCAGIIIKFIVKRVDYCKKQAALRRSFALTSSYDNSNMKRKQPRVFSLHTRQINTLSDRAVEENGKALREGRKQK